MRARERAQAARLLHRRHLLLAGRLALRHVVHLHMVVDSFGTGRLLGYLVPAAYQRGSCNGLSAGFMLRARAARDCARRHARSHRHGRLDFGLDSFHLSLVQPLGLRVGGRHLVLCHHLH